MLFIAWFHDVGKLSCGILNQFANKQEFFLATPSLATSSGIELPVMALFPFSVIPCLSALADN